MSDERTIRIRDLNDELRTRGYALNGRIVAMGGLGHDDQAKQIRVVLAASKLADWTEGDDPYGEHDFGKFMVEGEAFIFKIDTTVWTRPTVPSIQRIRRQRSG